MNNLITEVIKLTILILGRTGALKIDNAIFNFGYQRLLII